MPAQTGRWSEPSVIRDLGQLCYQYTDAEHRRTKASSILAGHTQNRSWTRERLPARTDRWTEPSAVTCRSEILDNYATSTLTPNIDELRRARYWQVTHRTGPGHVLGCRPGLAGGLGLVP
ncbi:hypothetical protein J6590_006342 [Homalodisca vitripennis]|nr:hypothetical protein J6590_006342 [Homalodisca vitripennis]